MHNRFNGLTLSEFSTWLSKPGEVGNAVETALKEGYVHVDCAHIYGNEAEVGVALQKCFTEGVIKRENLFVTSKLWYGHINLAVFFFFSLINYYLSACGTKSKSF